MFRYQCTICRQNTRSFKNQLLLISCYLEGSSALSILLVGVV